MYKGNIKSKEIGARFKHIRKTKTKFSQKQMAEKLQIPPNYFGGIERGDREATYSIIEDFADICRVPISVIFGKDTELSGELKGKIPRLSPDQVNALCVVINQFPIK